MQSAAARRTMAKHRPQAGQAAVPVVPPALEEQRVAGAPTPGGTGTLGSVAASSLGVVLRAVIMYCVLMFAMRHFTHSYAASKQLRAPASRKGEAERALGLTNGFADIPLELRVYVSEERIFARFDDPAALAWAAQFTLADGAGTRAQADVTVRATAELLRNETSAWAHIYVTHAGSSCDPDSPDYSPSGTTVRHYPLVQYAPDAPEKQLRSLVGGEREAGTGISVDGSSERSDEPTSTSPADPAAEPAPSGARAPQWRSSMLIQLSADITAFPQPAAMPEAIREHVKVFAVPARGGVRAAAASPLAEPAAEATGTSLRTAPASGAALEAPRLRYAPRPFVNEVWLSPEALLPLNASVTELPLHIEFSLVSLMKLTLMSQLAKAIDSHAERSGGHEGERGAAAAEELRRLLTETSPWLLAITFVVTVLHSLFDFLAFQNDIRFWRGTKSMEGLSSRALLVNVTVHFVIFLYLVDNDTSRMVVVSNGVALAIEAWKVHRVCALELAWAPAPLGARVPWPRLRERHGFSHARTATYDQQAAGYVAWVLLPLVAGVSCYSLLYSQHKSWCARARGRALRAACAPCSTRWLRVPPIRVHTVASGRAPRRCCARPAARITASGTRGC